MAHSGSHSLHIFVSSHISNVAEYWLPEHREDSTYGDQGHQMVGLMDHLSQMKHLSQGREHPCQENH